MITIDKLLHPCNTCIPQSILTSLHLQTCIIECKSISLTDATSFIHASLLSRNLHYEYTDLLKFVGKSQRATDFDLNRCLNDVHWNIERHHKRSSLLSLKHSNDILNVTQCNINPKPILDPLSTDSLHELSACLNNLSVFDVISAPIFEIEQLVLDIIRKINVFSVWILI